jgi:Tol biopolymer transport system component
MKSTSKQNQPGTAKRGQVILAVLVLLATSLACSFSLPFPASHPTSTSIPAAPLGRIAYVGIDGNIYTTDQDGKQQNAITQDASLHPSTGQTGRVYQFFTWAPDGQHLAFVRIVVSQGSQEASVLSALSDGHQPVTNFTSQDVQPFYLFWSPNSQSIAFLGSDAATGALSQYLVPALGGQSKLISQGSPYYWDWSPDNNSMIVHIGGTGSDNPAARLAFLGADGSNLKGDLKLKAGSFEAPAWSTAGDTVALATQNDAGTNQLILASPNGNVKQVLASLSGPVSFAWSPTDNHLAYAVYDTSGSVPTVHLVVLDSAHPDQTDEVAQGAVAAFFWSPDGQKIAYFVLQNAGVHTSAAHTAAPLKASVELGVWVYDRAGRTAKKVATVTPTDAFQQILNFYSQYQRSDTIWSPDSQKLVLSSVDASGKNAIYTVGADGSNLKKIADGDLAFWAWK